MAMTSSLSEPTAAAHTRSVVLIEPNPARREAIIRMLEDLTFPALRACASYPESRYLDELMALSCDVFIIDLDSNLDQALALIEKICGHEPAATVMATSARSDPDLLIRSMQAGAREFLPEPLTAKILSEAMARALARREKSQELAPSGKILMFMGAKGGSGVTTV